MSSLTAPSSVPLPVKTSKQTNFFAYGMVVFGLVFGPAVLAGVATLIRVM